MGHRDPRWKDVLRRYVPCSPRRLFSDFLHAQRFNRRHARAGHVFQDRFGGRVIETDEQVAAACPHVLANPVRAGPCERAHDWRWSGGPFAEAGVG
jgi:hypothetical protein